MMWRGMVRGGSVVGWDMVEGGIVVLGERMGCGVMEGDMVGGDSVVMEGRLRGVLRDRLRCDMVGGGSVILVERPGCDNVGGGSVVLGERLRCDVLRGDVPTSFLCLRSSNLASHEETAFLDI